MNFRQQFAIRSYVLKGQVNKYAILGLGISFISIIIASVLASYQQTGFIDFPSFVQAQKSNPALWALDFTPFIFAYWGQSFCYELASTMETMLEDKTRELVNKSSDLELKLQYETNHDHLTNLPNQRLLSERINQGIEHINKGEELALIILHIHSFNDINYKYGSFNGNNVLVQFAEKLKTVLLEPYLLQSHMGMNMVARLQGAEFAILIPRLRKEHQLEDILTKLLAATSTNVMIDGNNVKITTAAGIATSPSHGRDDVTLLNHASSSLFYAEKKGLTHMIYHSGMQKSMKVDHARTKEVRDAIDNETFDVWFQPEMELTTEKIIGAGTLAYFDHGKLGVMTADKILLYVEGLPLVKKISHVMLNKAISQLAIWHQAGHKIYTTVSIFDATDVELPTMIAKLLKKNKLSAEYLKIELTEKACLSNQAQSLPVLKKIAELGVKLVISDFCSGYTSFTYLTNFPINEIKIDKSFVMNMMNDEKKLSIVRAVIKLAETMNLVVFADGIVDLKSITELKKLHCLYGQGLYFSSELNAAGISTLLDKK